ncbi:MAG: methylmalonyl Co-A mutase-associated GTPase MeaB [Salibacteraceae bacterium]
MSPRSVRPLQLRKSPLHSPAVYVEGILAGNRTLLSQAITLVESTRPNHRKLAERIIDQCLPHSGNAIRIGITGVPGVGKSTFIEAMGKWLTNQGHRLAVLAVDPTSQRSRGSILGDKTRMEHLASDPNAYIRPSPSGGSLGGVARATRETTLLCEAAGFDTIFIETVGVGQSETAVHGMVDFFLLLMLAGAGDELQGIKRGIMEMADTLVINKADGDNLTPAKRARAQYKSALHLFPPNASGWSPQVLTCSAMQKSGMDQIWETVHSYLDTTRSNGFFQRKREEQSIYWMREEIGNRLNDSFYQKAEVAEALKALEKEVREGKLSSFSAASQLFQVYRKS